MSGDEMTEDEMAALWRARQKLAAQNRRRVGRLLAGDPAAQREVEADWAPLVLALREARSSRVDRG